MLAAAALLSCAQLPQDFIDSLEPIVVVDGGGDAGTPDAGPFIPAAHQPWPTLPRDGGLVLSQARLVSIVPSNNPNAASYYAFADGLPASSWWASFQGEYGVGIAGTSAHLTGPPMTTSPQLADLVAYVQAVVDGGIPLDGTNIFLVYLPAGLSLLPGFDCGYHTPYPSAATSVGDSLATVADGCLRQFPGELDVSMVIDAASHEIAEAATDPLLDAYRLPPPQPISVISAWQWLAPGAIEVGDICEGTRWLDAQGVEYQRIFSDLASLDGGDPCVPSNGAPYFNVSPGAAWYAAPPGRAVDIPLTGWSTQAVPAWSIAARVTVASQAFLNAGTGVASLQSPLTGACKEPMIQNGSSATLHVSVPSNAVHNDFAVFSIHSQRLGAGCSITPLPDAYHQWPVVVFAQ